MRNNDKFMEYLGQIGPGTPEPSGNRRGSHAEYPDEDDGDLDQGNDGDEDEASIAGLDDDPSTHQDMADFLYDDVTAGGEIDLHTADYGDLLYLQDRCHKEGYPQGLSPMDLSRHLSEAQSADAGE